MKDSLKLTIEQHQNVIITPELKQSFEILQMNVTELSSFIEQEILENPILEIDVETDEKDKAEEFSDKEINWDFYKNKSDTGVPLRNKRETSDKAFENFHKDIESLYEFLDDQLNLLKLPVEMHAIGEYLLGNIDDNGYLKTDTIEVTKKFKCSETLIEDILMLIQGFEPLGVGARNLSECLLIQSRSKTWNSQYIEQLIKFHLYDLAEGKWNKVAKCTNSDLKKVQEAFDLIKTLDPKPGSNIDSCQEVIYVIPDVIVEKINDDIVIYINEGIIPNIAINHSYLSTYQEKMVEDKELASYIDKKINSASWIIKSIEQRNKTIKDIAKYIFEYQDTFFEKGISQLKPLTLKQVSTALGIHESTVSRTVNKKYVQTPKGIFEMKCFFENKVKSNNDEGISSCCIKARIKRIINEENKEEPLSDQQISDILKKEEMTISRRTVAKYRDEMNIKNALQRKRY